MVEYLVQEPRPSTVVVQQALDVEVVLNAHFLKPFAHGRVTTPATRKFLQSTGVSSKVFFTAPRRSSAPGHRISGGVY